MQINRKIYFEWMERFGEYMCSNHSNVSAPVRHTGEKKYTGTGIQLLENHSDARNSCYFYVGQEVNSKTK